MTLPRKISKPKMRQNDRVRCPAHLRFIREHHCSVVGCSSVPTVAHHVRKGLAGGTGLKPSDALAIALCNGHHTDMDCAVHRVGEEKFERIFNIDLVAKAAEFAASSDVLWRYLARRKRAA